MYCLEVIQSPSFQAGKAIKDNHNRDSSFCKSRGGYVIHSGIHRETAFVSLVDHTDGYESASYWFRQGQAAINGWIEATIGDHGLEACEQNAIAKALPEWSFRRIAGTGKGGVAQYTATKPGKLPVTVSALSWRLLHAKLQ